MGQGCLAGGSHALTMARASQKSLSQLIPCPLTFSQPNESVGRPVADWGNKGSLHCMPLLLSVQDNNESKLFKPHGSHDLSERKSIKIPPEKSRSPTECQLKLARLYISLSKMICKKESKSVSGAKSCSVRTMRRFPCFREHLPCSLGLVASA